MHLLPDSSTALGTGCAVLAFGTDLQGVPMWLCTVWFGGVVTTSAVCQPEPPTLSGLIESMHKTPARWEVIKTKQAAA